MAAFPFGAVAQGLGAGISAITQAVQGKKQRKQNEQLFHEQQDFEREQADLAYQRQQDFYTRQLGDQRALRDEDRAYNDPAAVMARNQAAGLRASTGLAAGNTYQPSQSGGAPSAPSVPQGGGVTPPYTSLSGPAFPNIGDEFLKVAQAVGTIIKGRKDASETGDRQEFLRGQKLNNTLVEENIIGRRLANNLANLDYQFKTRTLDFNVQITKAEADKAKKEVSWMDAQLRKAWDEHEREPLIRQEIESRIYMNNMQAALMEVRSRLTEAQITTEGQEFLKKVAETEQLSALKDVLEKQAASLGLKLDYESLKHSFDFHGDNVKETLHRLNRADDIDSWRGFDKMGISGVSSLIMALLFRK